MLKTSVIVGLCGQLVFTVSCRTSSDRNVAKEIQPIHQDELIRNQQIIIEEENIAIEDYIKRKGYPVNRTETGLRYYIYKKGTGGRDAGNEKVVTIRYDVSLLDGTRVYSSDSTGNMQFKVGKSDIASGLQEGIAFMREGDQALFILPSHLAYGLTGDGDKIKRYEALVIDVELIKVSEP